ncbi:DMT family transporter (plasmid) [Halorussus limi]|uniref:DMT family transporter n=1 Tax=Halorussus limi TaxID=2938695 RepID=A0A8U0HYZ0_9EURY|nr:DMT family transporter [Halorussus limi]UPV76382.1 DMT family transporter [Halorussus limi]
MARTPTAALAPLAAASLWGGMYVVSKWGFASIPPVTLGFLRVALGAATLLAVVRRTYPDRDFSASDRRGFLALGGWVTLTIVTQFVGTDLTNASQGALLTVLTPVFTLLLGVAVLSEPLTRRKAAGMALASVGTLLVLAGRYDVDRVSTGNAVGVAALLAASFAWAGYTVYGKSLVRAYSALETATYSTVAAVPMLGVLAAAELALTHRALADATLSIPVAGAVLYLGVASTAAAWYLWYKGLEYVDAGTVAVFFFVQPFVGAFFGAVLLGEAIGPGFVVGGLVMALGVYVVSTSTTT